MRLFLFSLNYAPEPTGTGLYSGGMAESLAERGHEVTVFSSHPFYPDWRYQPGVRARRWTREVLNGVTVHRCPVYLPRSFNAITRMLHYGSFALACLLPALRATLTKRPGLVINVAPTLVSAPIALLTAKLAGASSWLHVQDFEVEAGLATNQMQAHSLIGRLAFRFERFCINAFDRVSSSAPEMNCKLVEKGRDPASVYEFRNWSDVENIFPQNTSSYRAEWRIATPHVALYSGAIAQKQGIEMLIDVARQLGNRRDITFVICGNGPNRALLEQAAKGVSNLQFHDLQPKERLNDLLNLATIHLLPQKADAADLLLPSKLTNILASGRPVVVGAASHTGLAREMAGCGLAVLPEQPAAMAEGICRLIDDPGLWQKCATNARARALEIGSRTIIIDRLDTEFMRLVTSRAAARSA